MKTGAAGPVARTQGPWPIAAAALTGVPLLAGQLAGPAFSQISESGVLSALMVGAGLAGGVLALAWAGARHRRTRGAAARRSMAWVAVAAPWVLIQAFAVVWTAAALKVVGWPGTWGWGLAIVLPWLAAVFALGGGRWVLPATASVALAAWVVFLAGFPWPHPVGLAATGGLNGSISLLGPGAQALIYPAHVLRAAYSQRWWDDVALAAAAVLLCAPWLWLVGWADALSLAPTARHPGWEVAALVGAAWLFMALGTQQSAGLNPLVGGLMAAVPGGMRWVGLVAWVAGLTAAFGAAWAQVGALFVGPVRRMAAMALPSAAAGFVAWAVLGPLTDLPGWPRAAVPPLFINAEAGLLMVAYLGAPALGALAVAALWGRTGRRLAPAWLMAAWVAGLAASLPGVEGFHRWSGGPFWHHLLAGVPAGYGLGFFWLTPVPGPPDWGLAAGVGVAALVSAGRLVFQRAARVSTP